MYPKIKKEDTTVNMDRFVACEVIKQTLGANWFNFKRNEKHNGLQCLTQPAHADGSTTTIEQLYKFCTSQQSLRLKVARSKKLQESLNPLLDLGVLGTVFAKTLASLPVGVQPVEVVQALTDWFALVLSGQASTVVAAVCPDYNCENGVYKFDFLGEDVGLVANRVLLAMDQLAQFMQRFNLPVSFLVAMADQEATPANCERVGLLASEFRRRMRVSQGAFKARAAGKGFAVTTPFITEINGWTEALAETGLAVEQGQYAGPFQLTAENIRQMAETRRTLYESWHGRGVDVEACLRSQIPEYMAVPTTLFRAYPNPLIMDAAAPIMRILMHGLSATVRPMIGLDVARY